MLDNNEVINTYDDVILNNNLLFKKEINTEMLNNMNNETLYYECYNKVLKYIDKKIRSEKEISNYIDKIGSNYKCEIIEKLKEINLINDENYAKAYISDKIYLSTDGPIKIKQDLLKYDIDESIIEESISKIDYNIVYEKCKKLIIKKIKANTKYSSYMLNQKIISDLLNKGYELSMIKSILEDNTIKNDNIIEKEYKKLYSKLNKKYEGEELYSKIRMKLYQKGFSNEEIIEYTKTVD